MIFSRNKLKINKKSQRIRDIIIKLIHIKYNYKKIIFFPSLWKILLYIKEDKYEYEN